jgi:hypothetical protein
MSAIVYALPAPRVAPEATVLPMPRRTKHGDQQVLPFEWPGRGISVVAPRVPDLTITSFDPQPTRRGDLPPAGPWSLRLVQGMVEVINGVRPASQLTRWVTIDVMSLIQQRVLDPQLPRYLVRSVHVSEPDDGVAEVCSVFGTPNRSFALAMRLEGLDGRWRATSLVWAT